MDITLSASPSTALSTSLAPNSPWGQQWTVSGSASLPTVLDAAWTCLQATTGELRRFRVDPAALQRELIKLPQIELEEKTTHQFTGGMYCRSLVCPAGGMFIGRVHKKAHVFILLSGEGVFFSSLGSVRLKAPAVFISPPGEKRAGLAAVESTILNISNIAELGECTDLERIEEYLYEPDPDSKYTTGNRLI